MAYDTYMHLFFKKQPNGKLGEIIVENNKSSVQVGEAKGKSGDYPFFTSGDAILEWDCGMVDGRNCFLNTSGNAGGKFYVGEAAYSTDTWCITANSDWEDYLYLLLLSIKPELNQKFFQGTGLKHLQKPLLKDRLIYIPSEEEIKGFNSKVLVDFYIEILTCSERVLLGFDFIVYNSNREIIDSLFVLESGNNLLNLKITQTAFLIISVFVFFAHFRIFNEHDLFRLSGIIKK